MISAKWNKFKLGDIAQIVGGGTPSTSKPEYWGGDIPWVTPRDLSFSDERFVSHGERSITEEGLKNSSTKVLPKGAVLLTTRAPIGYLRIAQNPICTNQGFKSLIPDEEVVNSHFLYYLLRNNVEYLKSVGVGSTFAEISGSALSRLEFMFPPLETQEKIVEILSALDEKIELNRQTNATLEAIAQAVFKEWFIDFNFPGATGEMVSSPLGPIPKGWKVGVLGDIMNITMGQSPPGRSYNEIGHGPPFFQGKADFGFRFPRKRVFTTDPKRFAKKHETLLSVRAPVGEINMSSMDCCIGRGLASIIDKKKLKSFTFYYLSFLKPSIQSYGDSGTVFSSISKRELENVPCILPPREIALLFEQTCSVIDERIELKEDESQLLAKLRDVSLLNILQK